MPYIWAERCPTFGLRNALHQSSRCISKSSKRPYAQNDPKVTRRAFFSQYSGRVSAQILQNHIGGVFQPIHIRSVSQPIFGACFSPSIFGACLSPYSGRVSAHIRGVFQPIFGVCFSPGIRQAFGPWRVQILCLCLWPFRSFCSIYLS
jgi:hypothetical protein